MARDDLERLSDEEWLAHQQRLCDALAGVEVGGPMWGAETFAAVWERAPTAPA